MSRNSHSRRRSISSSSSSASSDDEEHRKKHRLQKDGKPFGGGSSGHTAPDADGRTSAAVTTGVQSYQASLLRDLSDNYQLPSTQRRAKPMSGPGYPSTPPPYAYGSPSYGAENTGFVSMPNTEPHPGGFAPPPGPPPFPAAHSPGFPTAEHEKASYGAERGAPEFPTSPQEGPSFPTSPHEGPSFPTSPHDTPAFPTSPRDGPGFPTPPGSASEKQDRGFHIPGFPHHDEKPSVPPPAYSRPPPSGFRVPLTTNAVFPSAQAGAPVAYDADGTSPVYIGSALLERSVHPCKIAPRLTPPCRVPYGGAEFEHHGRFDLLPFDPATMEWVPTSQGRIPQGRRPVEGGYEEHGGKLYHALATVQNVRVPGKTGEHLGGCNVAFGGGEHVVRDYDILCWR